MFKKIKENFVPMAVVAAVVTVAILLIVTKKNADGSARVVKANLFTDKKAA